MWSSLTEWVVFLLVVWMAARLLSKALSRPQPVEPDDYADVPASLNLVRDGALVLLLSPNLIQTMKT